MLFFRTTTGTQAITSNISKAQATLVDMLDMLAMSSRDYNSKVDTNTKAATVIMEVTTATIATTTKSPATLLALMTSNP